MPRGGARQGKPGKQYANRSDLRAAKPEPVPAEYYGHRREQQEQIDAIPPPPQAASARGGVVARPAPIPPLPLDRPSERPFEPITAGLPTGAGPGPEALGMPDTPAAALRAWYVEHPHEEIRELIELLEAEGR